jgi:hypothetical protein
MADISLDILCENRKNTSECCICLYSNLELSELYMECCNNMIHQKCMFDILKHGHKLCPLCRNIIKLQDYFTKDQFMSYVYSLNIIERHKYLHEIRQCMYSIILSNRNENNINIYNYQYYTYNLIYILNDIYSFILSYIGYMFLIIILFLIFTMILIYEHENLLYIDPNSNSYEIIDIYYT